MMVWFAVFSWTFTIPAIAALALLSVHAVKSHGWTFGVIWLALPAILINASALLLHHDGDLAAIVANRVIFPGTADAAVYSVAAFYSSALLAKGFVERSRWQGSPVALAAFTAAFASLFATILVLANQKMRVGWACGPVGCKPFFGFGLGFEMSPAFPTAFTACAFFFALGYRLISLRTTNNLVKLVVLSACSPAIVAGACGLGIWLG